MTWEHGRYSGYKNHGCRCAACRAAFAAAMRAYRRRRMGRTGEVMRHGKFRPRP